MMRGSGWSRDLEPWLVGAAAVLALFVGFHPPPTAEWLEECLDVLAISLAVGGFVVASAGYGEAPLPRRAGHFRIGGWSLIAAGLCLILGRVAFAGGFGLVGGAVLVSTFSGVRVLPAAQIRPGLARTWAALQGCLSERPAALWRFLFLLFLFETWETVVLPGAGKHTVEIGLLTSLLALTAVGWAAASSGGETCGWERVKPAARRPSVARKCAVAAALLCGAFGLLAACIHLAPVQAVDLSFGHALYKSGSRGVTRLMRAITDAGGRDFLVCWLPLLLIMVGLTRKLRAASFFAATMLGTVGLELFFKGAVGRLRPEFVPHPSADSFPSGHTLAAAILGAGLVVVYLPVCRRAWQRAALFAGGGGVAAADRPLAHLSGAPLPDGRAGRAPARGGMGRRGSRPLAGGEPGLRPAHPHRPGAGTACRISRASCFPGAPARTPPGRCTCCAPRGRWRWSASSPR
jgi:hypothetical protein